jgi:hypothetical protein
MSRNIILVLMYHPHKLLDPDSNDRARANQNKVLLIPTGFNNAEPQLSVLHLARA